MRALFFSNPSDLSSMVEREIDGLPDRFHADDLLGGTEFHLISHEGREEALYAAVPARELTAEARADLITAWRRRRDTRAS